MRRGVWPDGGTPFSVCGQFSGGQNPPGWFGIGQTTIDNGLSAAHRSPSMIGPL